MGSFTLTPGEGWARRVLDAAALRHCPVSKRWSSASGTSRKGAGYRLGDERIVGSATIDGLTLGGVAFAMLVTAVIAAWVPS